MRTIIAALVILITAILQIAGIELSIADQEGLINSLVIIAGALSAVYFRYIATQNLHARQPLEPVTGPDTASKG